MGALRLVLQEIHPIEDITQRDNLSARDLLLLARELYQNTCITNIL